MPSAYTTPWEQSRIIPTQHRTTNSPSHNQLPAIGRSRLQQEISRPAASSYRQVRGVRKRSARSARNQQARDVGNKQAKCPWRRRATQQHVLNLDFPWHLYWWLFSESRCSARHHHKSHHHLQTKHMNTVLEHKHLTHRRTCHRRLTCSFRGAGEGAVDSSKFPIPNST